MSNSLSVWQPMDEDDTKNYHITLVVLQEVEAPMFGRCIFTYYQAVCSCGWSGDYKVSKLTAQEDRCPNRPSLKDTDAYKEAERLINQKGHK